VASEADPRRDLITNTHGTQLVAEYARIHGARIIFCNSIRVYDSRAVDLRYKQTGSISEDCPTIFESHHWSPPFSYSKYAAECILKWYYEKHRLPIISHRMSGVVGPGQRSSEIHGWVSYLIKCAVNYTHNKKKDRKKEKDKYLYTVFGTGHQTRDILHVDDYVDLVEQELESFSHFSEKKFNVYNIGGGPENEISLMGLISLLRESHELELNYQHDQARRGEPKHYVSSLEKIARKGWAPKRTGADTIIADLVDRYREGEK
jgi:CDP-paratose 2-epimerase